MAERLTAARPYADAVFELAKDRGELKQWGETLSAAAAVAVDPLMVRLAFDPKLTRTQLADTFIAICAKLVSLTAEAENFVRLLVENRRLTLLPEIAELYAALRGEAERVIEAEVTSAVALSTAQEAAIIAALKRRLQRDVKLSTRIDAAVVGGLMIRAGDLVIDGTVRGSLQRLAADLIQ